MKNKLIKASDNANFEISSESLEMLLHGVCKSFECEDFRSNNCRMKTFLTAIEDGSWRWNQTWMTPTKFFLHLIKEGENASDEVIEMFEEVKQQWNCIESHTACDCEFFDEMKKLRSALVTELEKDKKGD